MKKIIAIIALAIVLTNCSKKEDQAEQTLATVWPNLAGIWYFKETRKPNNVVVPYPHNCSSKREYLNFNTAETFLVHDFNADCSAKNVLNATYTFNGFPDTIVFGYNLPTSKVTITTTEMRLLYTVSGNPPTGDTQEILVLTRN